MAAYYSASGNDPIGSEACGKVDTHLILSHDTLGTYEGLDIAIMDTSQC